MPHVARRSFGDVRDGKQRAFVRRGSRPEDMSPIVSPVACILLSQLFVFHPVCTLSEHLPGLPLALIFITSGPSLRTEAVLLVVLPIAHVSVTN
jgi:hypothetical protein